MADSGGFLTPAFSSKTGRLADFSEVKENSARKGESSAYATPILCPRTPAVKHTSAEDDSLPTTYGKRFRDSSQSTPCKRFKDDPSSPKLCLELFKYEGKVLFPCYIEEQVVKSSFCPLYQRDESDCEVYESDEETVMQSQGILCSQLEKSIQDEYDSRECI